MTSTTMLVRNIVVAALALGAVAQAAPDASRKNFLLIAIDDLRPMFGASFNHPEVLTPNIDKFFLDGNGSAMQHSYVQIAVCGPSRASILTGRRPDTTHVGPLGGAIVNRWCWCQRSQCKDGSLFDTVPATFAANGYATTGEGKIYHPDACTRMHIPNSYGDEFAHVNGDDKRAWNYGTYGVEGMYQEPNDPQREQNSEEQFGTIPGPFFPVFNGTMGLSWMRSPLGDEEQTDGQTATNAIAKFANMSAQGIGLGNGKPFFHAVGFHKPHTPYIVPEKYFDLYDINTVGLAPNNKVPTNFKEENWHANGNVEISAFTNEAVPFHGDNFGFNKPVNDTVAKQIRLAYFAATSYVDSQVGRVVDALAKYGYKDNTVVALWSDHGYHMGDTNSWCKMTNFEKATRNTLLWRVPGQVVASQGRNTRMTEMVDFFPTVVDLMGLPPLPKCEGVDQPPTVKCLQGESYADEFIPSLARAAGGSGRSVGKMYAFSQWPYPANLSPGCNFMRMGYTVRSTDGYRFTVYVPYSDLLFRGVWKNVGKGPHSDPELYDYNTDPNETTNQAANPDYAATVTKLTQVLVAQYAPELLMRAPVL